MKIKVGDTIKFQKANPWNLDTVYEVEFIHSDTVTVTAHGFGYSIERSEFFDLRPVLADGDSG